MTVGLPSQSTGRLITTFGARLHGVFDICPAPGFHHPRLSLADLNVYWSTSTPLGTTIIGENGFVHSKQSSRQAGWFGNVIGDTMHVMAGLFVILHHTGCGPEHWDFMFEESDGLATWQCPVNPAELSPGEGIMCHRLPEHRRAYLTYEGPISDGRGEVRRVEEGRYECLIRDERRRRVQLHGRVLNGLLELRQNQLDGGWSLQRPADETR